MDVHLGYLSDPEDGLASTLERCDPELLEAIFKGFEDLKADLKAELRECSTQQVEELQQVTEAFSTASTVELEDCTGVTGIEVNPGIGSEAEDQIQSMPAQGMQGVQSGR